MYYGQSVKDDEKYYRAKKKRKEKKPFYKQWWFLLLVILFVFRVIVNSISGNKAANVTENNNNVAIVSPTLELTPDETPESTPETEMQASYVLDYVGKYTANYFTERNVNCKYNLPYDDCLCIYLFEDLSFEACKTVGAAGFINRENDLKDIYSSVVSNINSFESMKDQEYSVLVMYMSNDNKTIMSYSEAGIDYNIK